MSPNSREQENLDRIVTHYNQALDLTKGLMSELKRHGRGVDLGTLEERIKKRARILRKANRAAAALAKKKPRDEKTELRCQSIQRIAQEVHDLGKELICLLARVKDETRDEMHSYSAGAKLMKAYKGFKVRAPKRLSREA